MLVVGLVVVLLAGLGVGGYVLFKGRSSPSLTFDGKGIDKPDQPLQQAGSAVDALLASRHGAHSDDTRCYYGIPETPPSGGKKTDVDHSVWCGPLAFVDGDPSKEYLSFPLDSQPANAGKVTLTPSEQPASTAPTAVPAGLQLKRPDNKSAPSGPGGVAVPAPPPAAKDSIVSAPLGNQKLPDAPAGAAMGTGNGGIRITQLGPVTRYGTGDSARSAPDGQKLIAFTARGTADDSGDPVLLSRAITLSVNGGAGRRLPGQVPGQPYIVAVPTAARSADLVLSDGGVKQTVSLLTGKPGTGNIAVYARDNRTTVLLKSGSFTFRFSQEVQFPDGTHASSQTGTYSATAATLNYAIPSKHAKASSPANALLYIDVGYTVPQSPGDDFGFAPQLMTFTPKGGRPIAARNIAAAGKVYNIFEVPGNLTSGTLKIAGSFTATFANTGGSYTTTLSAPIAMPINISLR